MLPVHYPNDPELMVCGPAVLTQAVFSAPNVNAAPTVLCPAQAVRAAPINPLMGSWPQYWVSNKLGNVAKLFYVYIPCQ